ncbi:MAG: hypothetical protein GX605_06685 [Chloroflexi bacterium]|nr:hypothetical protein [Chloroflexota bacterium]
MSQEDPKAVQSLLERHRLFWEGGEAREPLLRVDPGDDIIYPLRTTHLPPCGRPVQVGDLSFDAFWHRYRDSQLVPQGSSVFTFAYPYVGFPWLEAMLGLEVEVSSDRANIWTRHLTSPDWDALLALDVADDNPWLLKLLAFVDELAQRGGGRFLVTPGHQGGLPHGPSDLLAAVLGNERMSYELYDNPQKVQAFLLRMTDVWIKVVRRVLEHIPPFHGGYANGYGVWAPGPAPIWLEDALLFFSPRNYERFLRACDEKAFAAFPYCGMHVHSGGAQVLDRLLEMENLRCVQLAWDSSGPPLDELLQMCRRIQERKPLILAGRFTPAERQEVLQTVSPRGFCFLPRTA